ncbi:MAG: 30S ribosomal protein S17 [Candidatus Pacebacteria bacterium]|nr:30S ribosomal protein S17 [Candidatus Paceibacterota bacterium]
MESKQTNQTEKTTEKRVFSGVVVSNKMKDTVVVQVSRYTKHPKYKKFIKRSKKYMAHDTGNTKQIGERVSIQETRPYSKNKSFVVLNGETKSDS